jgi:hypothetical protein
MRVLLGYGWLLNKYSVCGISLLASCFEQKKTEGNADMSLGNVTNSDSLLVLPLDRY